MIASRRDLLAGALCLPGVREFSASTQEPTAVIPLWGALMPGGPIPKIVESVDDQIDTYGFRYRVAIAVTRPTLSYFAAKSPTGATALLIPGGGYSRVGIDREGYETARWLAAQGVDAFVLRYRLPSDGWGAGPDVALQDAQRAIRLVRQGGAWKPDPQRVMVMGFSAGGHLAGRLAVSPNLRVYAPQDEADRLSARPDGAVLFYPVVNLNVATHGGSRKALLGDTPTKAQLDALSLDVNLPGTTPPVFLLHALRDRTVPVDQSLALFSAIRASDGPIDLHIFNEGNHGFGLRADPKWPVADWPALVRRWQIANGLA